MNKQSFDKEQLIRIILILAILVIVGLMLYLFPGIGTFFSKLFAALIPFIIGYALTLMLRPMMTFFEKLLSKHTKLKQKACRYIAVTISEILLLLLITLFFVLIVPQLISSLVTLTKSLGTYATAVQNWLNDFQSWNTTNGQIIEQVMTYLTNMITKITESLSTNLVSIINNMVSYIQNLVTGVGNVLVGIIISIYFLSGYEKTNNGVKKVFKVLLPEAISTRLIKICQISIQIFTKYVSGQALDALFVGVITLIACLIFRWDYPYLIGFVIGITNMIPFFGPFIGAIPCGIILFIIDPWKGIWFAIFILILQQFDGNFMSPHILGGSLGLPSILIIFAVLVGGGLFGVFGMILGVPVFALIYTLLKEFINRKADEKGY